LNEDLTEYIVSYVHKTYFKTASLIAYGCYGMGVGHGKENQCFEFGKHIGLAF
jgi:geranylgeranyl pyrophosphate synthase